MKLRLAVAASAALLVSGCEPEIVPEPYQPTSAHDAYRHSLEQAGLLTTALGRDWLAAGLAALRQPTPVEPPFREAVYVDSREAFAAGYRFSLRRGQRTEALLDLEGPDSPRLFVDLFRLGETDADEPVHVASADEGEQRLAFEPRRDGEYLLRVQSELLRGGRMSVVIRNTASLGFPVEGSDTSAIGSRFGAEREGGRREHHGVDIFADRHTPVRAPVRAWVRRVADWRLGGRVVWLHDRERNLHLYFAHLQTQEVEAGTWVEAGARIGSVGNSGNARTTPPHLHFGIYVRGEGPIDPYHFLHQPRGTPPAVDAELAPLGGWLRTRGAGARLRAGLAARAEMLRELPRHTPVRVLAAAGRSFRVRLPDGLAGYLAEAELEPVETALEQLPLVAGPVGVLDAPASAAGAIAELPAGATLKVLARFGEFAMVASGVERPGWVLSPPGP